MPKARVRGSTWNNCHKKRGFKKSIGSYLLKNGGDRQFNLTPVNGGKAREYSSPQAAERDGWVKE